MAHPLTEDEISQYRCEGFVVVESVFGAEDLVAIDSAIRELTQRALHADDASSILELEPESADGQSVPRRIYDPFSQHGAFRTLATDPRILDRIESLKKRPPKPPPRHPSGGK